MKEVNWHPSIIYHNVAGIKDSIMISCYFKEKPTSIEVSGQTMCPWAAIIPLFLIAAGLLSGCVKEEPPAVVISELRRIEGNPYGINITNDEHFIYFSGGTDPDDEDGIFVTLNIDTSEVSTTIVEGVERCSVLAQKNLVLTLDPDSGLTSRSLDHPDQVIATQPLVVKSDYYFGPSQSKWFAVIEARHIELEDGTDHQLLVFNPKTLSVVSAVSFAPQDYDFLSTSDGRQYEKPKVPDKTTPLYSIIDDSSGGVRIESTIVSKCEECSWLIGRTSSGSWVFRDAMPITRNFYVGDRKVILPRDFWMSNRSAIQGHYFIYDDRKGITLVDLDSGKNWRFFVKRNENKSRNIRMFFVDGFEGIGILSQELLYFLDLSGPEPRFVSLKDLFQ